LLFNRDFELIAYWITLTKVLKILLPVLLIKDDERNHLLTNFVELAEKGLNLNGILLSKFGLGVLLG